MAPSAISTPMGTGPHSDHITNSTSSFTHQLNGVHTDGHTNGHISSFSQTPPREDMLDLLCIGFGPASLAIAIALHDITNTTFTTPKTLFLEKQPQFAWHAGMQLPGAKMQISFLKDLATPRDPRSKFTFLNYLFSKGRLNHFINLSTFLPTRVEYEDYLRWCASHFEAEGKVSYGMEVEGVRIGERDEGGKVVSWEVSARDERGDVVVRKARNVVIAVGGKAVIPPTLRGLKNVFHSSQYANTISRIQAKEQGSERGARMRFAVVGGGQSAAEIFHDLWERFPDAQIKLIIKGASLRPSDDSPFVNEIFDPDRVDEIYDQDPSDRADSITLDRATNYGVVRLELLEDLYSKLYMQRLVAIDEKDWRCRIIPNRTVMSASKTTDNGALRLMIDATDERKRGREEEIEVDYVFTATGYVRNAHEDLLSEVKSLLPNGGEAGIKVGRNYKVLVDGLKVDNSKAGIWLQGCNEKTHGLSDTLLSILAVRGGELVGSIFGGSNTS